MAKTAEDTRPTSRPDWEAAMFTAPSIPPSAAPTQILLWQEYYCWSVYVYACACIVIEIIDESTLYFV